MKNLILIALLCITFGANAQSAKPIDGFLGIKFGSSSAQVIEAVKAKGGVVNAGQTATTVAFSNLSLGGRKVALFYVNFVNDKAFEAVFNFRADLEAKTIDYYNALAKDINGVYGEGKPYKDFKQPYSDGDGYEITAIKTGNATYETSWIDGENKAWISIVSYKDIPLVVRLIYSDGKLIQAFKDQQKEKNKSEF
ncbi:hypothetical protein HQ865_01475 [Mucilaginibacter mali]|uniref:DUF3108 domain-containing protein n=1 Tax=Mucilaginibacter mali TaxID=2740462 RepID=A0A7D4PRU8_9SPHI|nr:hypothetical protein [Mucilaginibacter mali]QKJ28483.1 hypothetical protein HQ865_01475 [Mucilaginibacter mali]